MNETSSPKDGAEVCAHAIYTYPVNNQSPATHRKKKNGGVKKGAGFVVPFKYGA